jgi:chromosome segregation ATPase
MRTLPDLRLIAVAALMLAAFGTADGQVARSAGSTSQAVQQLQQLAQERTALQADNARLKKQLDDGKAELKRAQAERDALKSRAAGADAVEARAKAASVANEQALQATRQKLEELVARFRETAQTLRNVETDRGQVRQALAEKGQAFDRCAQANAGLYDIADQALSRYERSAGRGGEPFTGLARARIENLVDDYRARAAELKLPPAAESPPDGRRAVAGGGPH